MSESYVQLPTDSTGKKLRTISHTVGANTVHDEVVEIADSSQTIVDPALKSQLPTSLSAGSNLKVSIEEENAPVSVDDGGSTISVDDGAANLSIDDGGNVISVDDAGASLTTGAAQIPTS